MKKVFCAICAIVFLNLTVFADIDNINISYTHDTENNINGQYNLDEQLEALGRDELMRSIPESARELMRETGTYELSVGAMLRLSPKDFFKTVYALVIERMKKPLRTVSAIVGAIVLCALIAGLKDDDKEPALANVFSTITVLCVVTSVVTPIFDCITSVSSAIQDAAMFMLAYIPAFSAAIVASGAPATGAGYNMFLFSACQIISQVIANTLIPLLSIYLALCVTGSLVPEMNMASASNSIKSIVNWTLGLFLTIFVGIFSIQTMVSQSADSVSVRAARFMLGSFVPVVGGALAEAYSAAQGCFRLLKTTMGAFGVVVSIFTFLPVLLQTVIWYILTQLASVASDVIGAPKISTVIKSCTGVLGILVSITLCFALLIIVSTTVVMVTGIGTA